MTIVVILAFIHSQWPLDPQADGDIPKVYAPGLAAVTDGIQFVDQNNQPFNTTFMANKIWLVNLFFTSCGGPCPIMTSQIKGVMDVEKKLHTLSISTDPDVDTPPVLKLYSEKYKVDASRWFMVRADAPTLMKFGHDILKLPIGEHPDAHSTRIVLIDGKGQIRGWYDSQSPDTRKSILRDLALIL